MMTAAEKRAYQKAWREQNKDRVRAYNEKQHKVRYAREDEREKRREYARQWREKNRGEIKQKRKTWFESNADRKRHYKLTRRGFTLALFDQASELQQHRCAICKVSFADLPKAPYADHCHTTNQPRGLLCIRCNTGIGMLGDDAERLRAAITYLESPPLSLA